MTQVDFYQLTRDPAEKILPLLAQKILGDGGRLLVVGGDDGQLTSISDALWHVKPESFLAHDRSGGGNDAAQPILLSTQIISGNEAKFIAITDGIWRDDALSFERIFYLFPPDCTDNARGAWRKLAAMDDVEQKYWRQDGGRWIVGP